MTIDKLLKTAALTSAIALSGCAVKDYTASERFEHAAREARVAREHLLTHQFNEYAAGIALESRELRDADARLCSLRDAYIAWNVNEGRADSTRVAAVVDSIRTLNARSLGESYAPCAVSDSTTR